MGEDIVFSSEEEHANYCVGHTLHTLCTLILFHLYKSSRRQYRSLFSRRGRS